MSRWIPIFLALFSQSVAYGTPFQQCTDGLKQPGATVRYQEFENVFCSDQFQGFTYQKGIPEGIYDCDRSGQKNSMRRAYYKFSYDDQNRLVLKNLKAASEVVRKFVFWMENMSLMPTSLLPSFDAINYNGLENDTSAGVYYSGVQEYFDPLKDGKRHSPGEIAAVRETILKATDSAGNDLGLIVRQEIYSLLDPQQGWAWLQSAYLRCQLQK